MSTQQGSRTADADIPNKAQQEAPQGLKENMHSAQAPGSLDSVTSEQSHAKGGGQASIVPQKVQEVLPESVERAVPNALHDTGDK